MLTFIFPTIWMDLMAKLLDKAAYTHPAQKIDQVDSKNMNLG